MAEHMERIGFEAPTLADYRTFYVCDTVDCVAEKRATAEAARAEAAKAADAPKEPEPEAKPEPQTEGATPPAPPAPPVNTAMDEPIVSVAMMLRQAESLNEDELMALAEGVNAIMLKRAELARIEAEQAERKAA